MLTSAEGNPFRPSEFEQREIEHVNNTSLKQRGVTTFGREELCHIIVALVEDETIEETVDEVAYGTG